MRGTREEFKRVVLVVSALCLVLIPLFAPMYWVVVTAFRAEDAIYAVPPSLLPSDLTLSNFIGQLQDTDRFLVFVKNGLVTSAGTALLTTVAAVMAAFTLSRVRFPGRRGMLFGILVTQMLPSTLLIVGIYEIYFRLGLLDSYLGMVIAFTAFALPFAIWTMRAFFDAVPREMEEAALVDGASRLAALRLVLLPVVTPGTVSVAIFAFLSAWNNLIVNLALTTREAYRTVPTGFLMIYIGEFQYDWGGAMAGSLIVSLPVVLLLLGSQRYLVGGLTFGAVKE